MVVGLADIRIAAQIQTDAAGVGFMGDVGRAHLHHQRVSHFPADGRGLRLGLGDFRPDHGQAIGCEHFLGIRFGHKSLFRRCGEQLTGFCLIEHHVAVDFRWNFQKRFKVAGIFDHIQKCPDRPFRRIIGRDPRFIQNLHGPGDAFTAHPAGKYRIATLFHSCSQGFGYFKGRCKSLGG